MRQPTPPRTSVSSEAWGLCPSCGTAQLLAAGRVGRHLGKGYNRCGGEGKKANYVVAPPWLTVRGVCPGCGEVTTFNAETGVCSTHHLPRVDAEAASVCPRSGSAFSAAEKEVAQKLVPRDPRNEKARRKKRIEKARRKKLRQAERKAAKADSTVELRRKEKGSVSVRTVSGGLPGLGKRR